MTITLLLVGVGLWLIGVTLLAVALYPDNDRDDWFEQDPDREPPPPDDEVEHLDPWGRDPDWNRPRDWPGRRDP